MIHAKEYVETMEALVDMIREVPKYSCWKFNTICDWFAYAWNRGTFSYVIDDFGVGQGVCVIKLFSRLEGMLEPFIHEPEGGFCLVDVLSAKSPQAIGMLYSSLKERWGPGRIMLWDRGARTEKGAPRMYRWDDYEKLTRRLTKWAKVAVRQNQM
jgi:hypothetical protein